MHEWIVRTYDEDEEWLWAVQTQNYIDSVDALEDAIVGAAQHFATTETGIAVCDGVVRFCDLAHSDGDSLELCGILDIFRVFADVSVGHYEPLTEETEWLP